MRRGGRYQFRCRLNIQVVHAERGDQPLEIGGNGLPDVGQVDEETHAVVIQGIPRIASILSQDGFPPAEYKTEGFFTTTLYKKISVSDHQSDRGGLKGGQKSGLITRERIVEIMRGNPHVTTVELAQILNINRSAVLKHIEKLKKDNVIERRGSIRSGEWIVLKSQPRSIIILMIILST